jgi:hypothetical protein
MSNVAAGAPSPMRLPVKGPSDVAPSIHPVATRSQLLKEYSEACANMRHYGNARLTRLVMFLALNGGLLNILFTHQDAIPRHLITFTEAVAAFVAILFGIVDYNIVCHFRCFNERARDVETAIGLYQYRQRQQMRDARPHNVANETNATYLMYASVYCFWLYCLVTY